MKVYITCVHENKVRAIKMLRSLTGFGLKEAKDVVDTHCASYDTPLLVETAVGVDGFQVLRSFEIGTDYVTSMDSFHDYVAAVSIRQINDALRNCMYEYRSATQALHRLVKPISEHCGIPQLKAEQLLCGISNDAMSGALDVNSITYDYVRIKAEEYK